MEARRAGHDLNFSREKDRLMDQLTRGLAASGPVLRNGPRLYLLSPVRNSTTSSTSASTTSTGASTVPKPRGPEKASPGSLTSHTVPSTPSRSRATYEAIRRPCVATLQRPKRSLQRPSPSSMPEKYPDSHPETPAKSPQRHTHKQHEKGVDLQARPRIEDRKRQPPTT